MTDPAVAAARRAFNKLWPDQGDFEFNFESSTRDYAIESAREALAEVRDLHASWESHDVLAPEAWQILDDLARIIYPEGELT